MPLNPAITVPETLPTILNDLTSLISVVFYGQGLIHFVRAHLYAIPKHSPSESKT